MHKRYLLNFLQLISSKSGKCYCQLLLLVLLCFVTNQILAQYSGRPFISNYSPEEYQASRQIFAAVQDSKGILYIANVDGVLVHDGEFWQKVQTPANSYVRSLAIDKDDRVYAGAYDDFGVLEPNDLGQIGFRSLINLLSEEDRKKIENIWSIQTIDSIIYFQAKTAIFQYDGQKVTKIPYSGSINRTSVIGNKLYLVDETKGVFVMKGKEFELIPKGNFFIGKHIYNIYQNNAESLFLVSRTQGVFLYHIQEQSITQVNEIPPASTTSIVYSSCLTDNGMLALGTLDKGLHLLTKNKDYQVLDESTGLANNRVISVAQMNNGNLFIGTQSGFSYVETATPVTYWDENNGLPGRITAMARFKGRLYVATEQGLFYFDNQGKVNVLEGEFGDIWDLFPLPEKMGGKLLIGTSGGVIEYDGTTKKNLSFKSCVDFAYSERFPQSVFFCNQSLVRLQYENGSWREQNLAPINDSWSIMLDDWRNIWIGTYTNGVCRVDANNLNEVDSISKNQISYYGTDHQLASLSNKVVDYNGELVVLNENKGVYQFNYETNQFDHHPIFQEALAEDTVLLSALAKSSDYPTTWFESESGLGFFTKEDGKLQPSSFKYINRIGNPPSFDTKIYPDQDGIVWVGSAKGLFRYDSQKAKAFSNPMQIHIRRVSIKKDSLIYGGYPVNQEYILPYAIGNIIFKYAATSFDKGEKVYYSYFLEGNDDDWSEWTDEVKKEYTNLWEGDYAFKVKARNRYGEITEEATFRFEVLSPWYRTKVAYLLYITLGILLLWGLLRLNSARLRAANERLEKTVAQRTLELKEKNDEVTIQNEELQQQQEEIIAQRDYIEQQKNQLQERNNQITDSIRYAETIQQGILPFSERLDKNLSDYFILYRPKDIVSGDFYWFERAGDIKLFALADCTGHGVPGAFMSMIGVAALNDIVLKSKITAPAQILKEVSIVLRRVLKGNVHDGMDIGICVWENTTDGKIKLTYSGAKRPLYWINNGDLEVIKGTRKSIDGGIAKEVAFEENTLILEPGTLLYLSSDGFADQNGEKNHKRIGSRKLMNYLLEIHSKPLNEQQRLLNEFLDKYQGEAKQRDDISLVGIQL